MTTAVTAVTAPLARHPLCCHLRINSQRLGRRLVSTASAATSFPPTRFHSIPTKDGRIRTAFAVYPPPPPSSLPAAAAAVATSPSQPPSRLTSALSPPTSPPPLAPAPSPTSSTSASPPYTGRVDVLRAYHQKQIARMDPTGARTALFSRKNPYAAKPGDVLLVTARRGLGSETFVGVCLAIRRSGIETAILLRNHVAKTAIERWFKIYSRNTSSIDIIQRNPRRARRARLTFMRHPKHDRGAVDDLVRTWRSSRNILRTRDAHNADKAARAAASRGKK